MTVLSIIKIVCDFVGESELILKLSDEESLTAVEKDKVDKMIRCLNLVNQQISTDYIPNLVKEEVDFVDKIFFSSLSKNNIIRVNEIRNRFSFKMKFKSYNDYVEFNGKAKTIIYSCLPEDVSALDDEIQGNIPAYVYAYGVASEYLLMDGVSEDADIWQEKYKQALFMLTKSHGEHILPARSWI